MRGTLRPLPMIPIIKGLRLTGFYDHDEYLKDAKKERVIGLLTFENPYINFGAQYEKSKDQTTSGGTIVDENGYSIWATPRLPDCGLEALIRWDRVTPDDTKARPQAAPHRGSRVLVPRHQGRNRDRRHAQVRAAPLHGSAPLRSRPRRATALFTLLNF